MVAWLVDGVSCDLAADPSKQAERSDAKLEANTISALRPKGMIFVKR
jgi:hypothetical protein